jgi:hypothetical protein
MKSRFLLIALIFLNIISIVLSNYFLGIDKLSYNELIESLAKEQVEQIVNNQNKWSWVGYAIIPLLILLRTSLVTLCISIGLFFYDIENKIKFKQLFRIALIGEFVLISVGIFKLIYFYFVKKDYTLLDIQQFYPLSYTNFLNLTKIEPWLIYPLQTINLFEIGYFFVLVYGLHNLLKNRYVKSFEIVAVSYRTELIIWLGLVTFLTLNFI